MAEPWWKSAVVYQIYPRSFADTDGDGVGDLGGITSRLEYLAWLGVDAIWLSPIFPSPMADFGYDVADYCDVDPVFGSLADLDRLVDEAHGRNIRVLLDWVPNHTSDRHPWFVESRSSRRSHKRDWYIWRDGDPPPAPPPNNWAAAFGGDAWTWDEATSQWYLHLFLPEQPDLNWRNPEVVEAMHATLRFWLDRGIDGFRVDVVHGLVKREDLADVPPGQRAYGDRFDEDATRAVVRGIRKVLEEYPGDRMMVGEVYLLSTALVARYYGDGDELHLAFNFPPLYAPWDAAAWRTRVNRVVDELDPRGAWPTWVLSNHDNPRHRTRYASEARARAAAVLLLTLRGTPFLYAGEEAGLEDAVIPPDRVVDPGGRDGCRGPIPWDGSPGHGWGPQPWLPFPPSADERNIAALRDDAGSILHLYRRLCSSRRRSPALQLGDFEWLPAPDGVLAYRRSRDDDRRTVVINFTDESVDYDPPGGPATIEVASDGAREGGRYPGTVGPSLGLILR